MKLPKDIWQLMGENQDGPNVTILGGTHGDELAGIEIIKKLLTIFNLEDKPSGGYKSPNITGNLFIGFGNPEAIQKQSRSASNIRDLNRYFIKDELNKAAQVSDTPDLKRARELAPLLAETDFLFDIHATSNPAPQFICTPGYVPADKKYFELIPVEKILADPDKIISQEFDLAEPGTSDYYVFKYGGSNWSKKKYGHKQAVALCYETGYQSDLSKFDEIFLTIIRLINSTGVINNCELTQNAYNNFKPHLNQTIFKLTTCFKARYDGFIYQKNMDQGWQSVAKGQLLGNYSNGEAEYIKNSAILLFPLGAHKVRKGRSLYWLAQQM
jgi:succinylglutamate desuccinylase